MMKMSDFGGFLLTFVYFSHLVVVAFSDKLGFFVVVVCKYIGYMCR